ncbi:MAG TPA: tetratricopeptide repeat protein [Draconibacterium sp.]|nr:tetratricopeptide repeat protein [Draconibacterium sp.]
MKYCLAILLILFTVTAGFSQQKQDELRTNSQLALTYYNTKDYEKAAPLLLDVYHVSRNRYYFSRYIYCMVQMERFDEAIDQLKKEIGKQKDPNPELLVNWGYILQAKKRDDEAREKFEEAIENIAPNKGSYLITANAFLQWGEYELAEKTYLMGREKIPQEQFDYELARVYLYLRDYDKMMEEYLNLVRHDEKQLPRVQSSLASAMRLDIENGLRDKFRGQVLKRIQAEPNVTGYNRLLIWFFLQEKKFPSALRQSIALDKRTGEEDAEIAQLGQMALNNKNYSDAQKAFEYLMGKGEESPFYKRAFAMNVHAGYLEYTAEMKNNKEEGEQLSQTFEKGLDYLGYSPATLNLIQEYAHLLTFYLDQPEKAISVLKKGLGIPRLKPQQQGMLKTEMADTYVYNNDPWEATLIYSQVIEANKNNSLGDEVKLKKARLAYYLGNFSWAKAQLDVLKASTSKLTANDAMELSLLIGNNLNLDTTAVPLTMFAEADLRFFQNKNEDAMTILNGLQKMYPYNSLVEDILYRKSKIEMEQQNYAQAAEYLQQIVNDFSYESLADDALYQLAELYNYQLNKKEQAKELYKQMIVDYPGSIYVDESRNKFRELREIYPDKDVQPAPASPVIPELKPNEFE